MTIRLIMGLVLLIAGAGWCVFALMRGDDMTMPGILVLAGGMVAAVEIARRRPGSIDD